MTRQTCDSCDKPLGNTIDKCFECGGENHRGGKRNKPFGHLVSR